MPAFQAASRVEVSPANASEPITLSVHQASPESDEITAALVFCHGFPDLAFGWRHQLTAIAEAGYRAIAPDQRGHGASCAPPRDGAPEVRSAGHLFGGGALCTAGAGLPHRPEAARRRPVLAR